MFKKMLSGFKALGVKLHATGGNYWLGFIPIALCVVLKAPEQVTFLVSIAFTLWLLLCVCSLMPDDWLVVAPREDKLTEALERNLQLEKKLAGCKKLYETEKHAGEALVEQQQALNALILKQFCFRITERLRKLRFDTASWDFVCLDPFSELFSHQTVRIKLHDAEDYFAAEVSFTESGELKLPLMEHVAQEEEADSEQVADKAVQNIPGSEASETLKTWMDKHMNDVMNLGYDAYAKGRTDFTLKNNLPDKNLWPFLCALLEQQNFRFAKVSGDGIMLGIGPKTKAA